MQMNFVAHCLPQASIPPGGQRSQSVEELVYHKGGFLHGQKALSIREAGAGGDLAWAWKDLGREAVCSAVGL
jgi:hypothetical protein